MIDTAEDYYQLLGLSPDADADTIKRRYRDLAKRYHPDVDRSDSAAGRFRLLIDAYHALGDSDRRAEYDLSQCGRLWGAVTLVNRVSLPDLEAAIRYWQLRVFHIDGARVIDTESLLDAACEFLPLPRDADATDWNGLEDGLWQSLADMAVNRGDRRIAILWTQAQNMLRGGLPDLLLAIDCFRGLSAQVATTEFGFPRSVVLRTFLIGEGANFPAWNY